MNVFTGEQVAQLDVATSHVRSALWTPDGSSVVFQVYPLSGEQYRIIMEKADGNGGAHIIARFDNLNEHLTFLGWKG